MNRARLRKLITAAAGLSLVGLSAFAPIASAATPDWEMEVVKLPPQIQPGANAGFEVSITNRGPSNISALWLTDSLKETPLLAQPDNGTSCESGQLLCALGVLSPNTTVRVLVVYATLTADTKPLVVTFQANTNGSTLADKKGSSRGDALNEESTVELSKDADFAGGFLLNGGTVANASITRQNVQSTRLDLDRLLGQLPATVEDGITYDFCFGLKCTTKAQFGQWSDVQVARGLPQPKAFSITITILGNSLPSPKPKAAQVVVFHTPDVATPPATTIVTEIIDKKCSSSETPNPGEGPCVHASYVGPNLVIVVWVYQNGKFRGAV